MDRELRNLHQGARRERQRLTPDGPEPGHGTQAATLASPPDVDDDLPSTYQAGGKNWKVGREYWDARDRDLVRLVKVIGRSDWTDSRDPEDCPPKLVFERDMPPRVHGGNYMVDPNDPDCDMDERFTLRVSKR